MLLQALVLRPLIRERVRTALTVAGIAAGVAVLVAIQLANQSALRAFDESVDAVSGRASFQIVSDAMIDESELLDLQVLWDHGGRFAPVIDVEGVFEPADIPIRVLGVDLLSDLHFRDYRFAAIQTGTAPAPKQGVDLSTETRVTEMLALFREDAIVLPIRFANDYGLHLGDTIRLNVLGYRRTFVIRGLLEARGPATAFNGSIAIVDIATAQKAFGLIGRLSRIDLLLPPDGERALSGLKQSLPPGIRLERPSRRSERVRDMLKAFRINLFALAAVSLLVGIFLVHNTVLISILRRRTDVGVARTLGASAGQIFLSFVSEGFLFGLIGSALGIASGWLLARMTLGLISRTIDALYVATSPREVLLTPSIVIGAFALGTLVSVLSALQPSLEAAAIPPDVLIRAGIHQRVNRSRVRIYSIAGLSCFVVAWFVTQIPPIRGVPVGGYVAVLVVVAGFSLLVPFTILVTARLCKPFLERFLGMTGKLAASALPASLRRVAVAGAALSIAIAMMVAVSIMIGSFRETVRIWVGQTVRSDLWLRPAKGLSNAPAAAFPEEISTELERIPFVAAFDRFRGRDMLFRDALVIVGSGDLDVAMRFGDLPMVTPRSAAKALSEAIARRGVLISESLAVKYDLDPGDTVELATMGGIESFPVTGVYHDYSNDRGVIIMDRSVYIRAFRDSSINTIAIFLRPGTDADTARVTLEKLLGPKYRAFGFTNATIRREVMRIFDQTFLVTWALLVIALAVAVFGIVNTLSALILERRREVALLSVLGMSAGQIRSMIVLESVILGSAATVLGTANGWALSMILIRVINRQSFGWTIMFDPPLLTIGASLAVTFVATVVAGFVPAALATRIRRSDALASE